MTPQHVDASVTDVGSLPRKSPIRGWKTLHSVRKLDATVEAPTYTGLIMTIQAKATFEIESWNENAYDEEGPKLTKAVVKKSFPLHALADACFDEQVGGALLEHAGTDALLHILPATGLEHD